MFSLNPAPTFVAPVTIAVPGKPAATLKMVFKHKTKDEAAAFFKDAATSDEKEAVQLLQIVAGWEDVDSPFSVEALERLLQNYHNAAQAIFQAYMDELTQARKGN
jgi:hypothetical protein